MKVLNQVKALNNRTSYGIKPPKLNVRMYMYTYEINRIGRVYPCEKHIPDLRNDMTLVSILYTYIARKVFINEKLIYNPEERAMEEEFTTGLWNILCYELLEVKLPELNFPTTYDELQEIFDNREYYKTVVPYNIVNEAIVHSNLVDSKYCRSMVDFDLHCSLPGDGSYTSDQHRAALCDGRSPVGIRLVQMAIGFYLYDMEGAPEPYQHFWKSKAELLLKTGLCLLEKSIILKFRNATSFEENPNAWGFHKIENFIWNPKNRKKK